MADILVAELDAAGVAPIDQELVLGVLAPTCCDIVAESSECEGLFHALDLDISCDL